MICLLDADIIAYRCSASAEKEPLYVALSRMDELIKRILYENNTEDYQCFLGGEGNWRTAIYPEYKANRKDTPRPQWLKDCKNYLRESYKATSEDGLEADDLLGIYATEYGLDSVICSIDKDLLQIPGNHYQWEISGTGPSGKQWIKPAYMGITSPLQGLRRFYGQVISGDGTDNVPSFDGKIRNSIPKFVEAYIQHLDDMQEEEEMYSFCYDLYDGDVADNKFTLHTNAQVLYVLKEREVFWKPPSNEKTDI